MARLIPMIVMSWVAHLTFITVTEGAEINILVSADKITEGSTLSSDGSLAAIDSSALDNATLQQSVDSFTICMRIKFRNDTSMTSIKFLFFMTLFLLPVSHSNNLSVLVYNSLVKISMAWPTLLQSTM